MPRDDDNYNSVRYRSDLHDDDFKDKRMRRGSSSASYSSGGSSMGRDRSHSKSGSEASRSTISPQIRGERRRSRSYQYGGRRERSRDLEDERVNGIRLHVSDLTADCSKRELEDVFGKCGTLREVWVARNPPCFAFVVFKKKEEADRAIRKLDNTYIAGNKIRVTIARPRTRGTKRGSMFDPNMRCYTCGQRGHFSRECSKVYKRSFNRNSYSRSQSRGNSYRDKYSRNSSHRHRDDRSGSDRERMRRDRRRDTETERSREGRKTHENSGRKRSISHSSGSSRSSHASPIVRKRDEKVVVTKNQDKGNTKIQENKTDDTLKTTKKVEIESKDGVSLDLKEIHINGEDKKVVDIVSERLKESTVTTISKENITGEVGELNRGSPNGTEDSQLSPTNEIITTTREQHLESVMVHANEDLNQEDTSFSNSPLDDNLGKNEILENASQKIISDVEDDIEAHNID
ncbi:unnamed protein product [Gordionus sp. m RMFG-2023]